MAARTVRYACLPGRTRHGLSASMVRARADFGGPGMRTSTLTCSYSLNLAGIEPAQPLKPRSWYRGVAKPNAPALATVSRAATSSGRW